MKETTINKIKEGDFFKITLNGRVYVRGEYDYHCKEFAYCDFNDVNREHFCKSKKRVFIDFEF